jgi:crotonobetainyl-CoA:carnitine CoA-transferase CaiB-like acyl-CoA transferase
VRVTDDRIGELAVQGVVPKLSETPGHIEHLGVALGAHNQEIYAKRLGLSDEELAVLREEGVI